MAPRRSIALAASVTVVALAGCGARSADLVAADESETGSPGPAAGDPMAGDDPIPPGALAENEFIATVSAAERAARSVSMDMRIGSGRADQMRLAGAVRHGRSPAEITMDLTVSGSVFPVPLSVIVVDEAMYLDMGVLSDDKYVKYDLTDPNSPMGDLLTGVQFDPTAQVRGFRGAIEDFDVVGGQRLDGVDTTRYRVSVDTAKLLANLETSADAAFGPGVEPPEQVVYDFWVGPDRLPRRISFTVAGLTTRLDLSRWGAPLDIRAPAPGEITRRDPFAALPSTPLV